jgi:hypothetical protein
MIQWKALEEAVEAAAPPEVEEAAEVVEAVAVATASKAYPL